MVGLRGEGNPFGPPGRQHYQTAEQFAIKVIPRSKAKKANVEEANILKKLHPESGVAKVRCIACCEQPT